MSNGVCSMSWSCVDVECSVRKENSYFDAYSGCLNDFVVGDDDGGDGGGVGDDDDDRC